MKQVLSVVVTFFEHWFVASEHIMVVKT